MTHEQILVGMKFKLDKTGRTYEVTRISEVSVWFKDLTRKPVWREAKTTFVKKFFNGCSKI